MKRYAELAGNRKKQGIKSLCDNNLTLVEGRVIYDAFVLNSKIGAIYTHYTSGTICAAPTVTYNSETNTLTMASSGNTIKYTLDGTDPRDSATADTYSEAITTLSAGTYTVRAYAYNVSNIDSVVTTEEITVPAA